MSLSACAAEQLLLLCFSWPTDRRSERLCASVKAGSGVCYRERVRVALEAASLTVCLAIIYCVAHALLWVCVRLF